MLCENCNSEHEGQYGSGRFCCSSCARGFSTKSQRGEINRKVSEKLKGQLSPHKGKKLSAERKRIAKSAQKEYYDAKPFDEIGKAGKKARIILEQHSKCNRCGLDEWLGNPLVLELEHKDGNSQNDLRENLECLCPNCHSLTSTWRGRNKVKKISDEDMVAMLRETGSMHKTLLNFGMATKGGNYRRTKRLVEEHQITLLSKAGFDCPFSKLSPTDLRKIKELRNKGKTFSSIAEQFGVSRQTVASAFYGYRYA